MVTFRPAKALPFAKAVATSKGARPMKSKLLSDRGDKTYAVIFQTGDEAMAGLLDFAKASGLSAAHFTAIGAFSDAVLQYFDWQSKQYQEIPITEQVEVLALTGDVALKEGKPKIHAHVVLGRSDGTTRGGHLKQAHVRPTLEVMLTETPAHLQRVHDEQTGLALIHL
jgi:predicted DNA-binding protein with PD1-like motif